MKKQLTLIAIGTLFTAILITTVACKKTSTTSNESADEQAAITMASGATGTESLYDDAFDVVTQSSEQSGVNTLTYVTPVTVGTNNLTSNSFTTLSCAQVSISPKDTTTFPKTLTIDYGTGCTATNGITRKGSLSVTLTGKLRSSGTTVTVSFNNYSVNGYLLAGTYSFTPVAASGGGVNFNITVSNGSVTYPTGAVYAYSGTETFTQTAGIGTSTVTDDAYNISGNFAYSGNGNSITATITNPLVRTTDCPNITTGTITFTYKNLSGLLDFGTGTCDNIATITIGRTTSPVTLLR